MKRRKPVDPETVRKRIEKAIFALRKGIVIAGQEEWITSEQSSILSNSILRIEQTFMLALPVPAETESKSEACLPFWMDA